MRRTRHNYRGVCRGTCPQPEHPLSRPSSTMSGRLLGKVAIITGSTSGIGEATARRFLNEGASVVISGTNAAKGEALASTLGANARFKACDVRLESDIAALCDFTMAEFGRLDCMFNNAGASTFATMDGVTEDQFDNAMRLLVGSVVFGIKHAARHMGDSGGSIINNSSIAALRYNQAMPPPPPSVTRRPYVRARSIVGPVQALWWLVVRGIGDVINKDIATVHGSYCPSRGAGHIVFLQRQFFSF